MLTGTLISQLGNEDGMGPGAGSQAGLQGFSPSSPKAGAVHAVVLSDIGHICGARVGGKGKFCIKVRGLCTTESHKPTKRENGLHLMAGDEKVWEKGASLAGLPSSVLAGVQDMMIGPRGPCSWSAEQRNRGLQVPFYYRWEIHSFSLKIFYRVLARNQYMCILVRRFTVGTRRVLGRAYRHRICMCSYIESKKYLLKARN
mmetsp:Transcript_10031/g.15191  ORF Transcript_10031/g.15191 Transcript_10031/m.15191 type:complete len:201 (-) Transcript_10031:139-741(-)